MATPQDQRHRVILLVIMILLLNSNYVRQLNNGIYDFATYIYDDGFINDYTFYGAFYPLPSVLLVVQ
jgi:hypothetical protein